MRYAKLKFICVMNGEEPIPLWVKILWTALTAFLILLPCPLLALGIVFCRRRYLAGVGARISAAEYFQRRQGDGELGIGAGD